VKRATRSEPRWQPAADGIRQGAHQFGRLRLSPTSAHLDHHDRERGGRDEMEDYQRGG